VVTKLTIGLVLLLFAVPSAATAQQPRKVYRVGYLYEGVPHSEALSEGLRDLGWVLGENLVIEYWQADGPPERLQALLTDLLQLNVDVIVVVNTRLATAAKRMTQTVPLVVSVGDPVRTGLVTSLARPEGNLTGVANQNPELRRKALQFMMEVVPSATQVGFYVRPDNPAITLSWQELQAAAPTLGVKMRRFDVKEPADLERPFVSTARERVGGLIVPREGIFVAHRRRLIELAVKSRLPVLYTGREFIEAGGLMSFAADENDLMRRVVARYVDRILKGAKPSDLPFEQPTQIRAGHQPENRQGARPQASRIAAAASRSGARMIDRGSQPRPSRLLESLAGAAQWGSQAAAL